MSYPNEVVTRANEITSARRLAAEQTQRARHREISEKAPDIIKYEAQLAETGLAVLKALTMGGDAQKYIKELSEQNLNIQKCIRNELVKAGYPADYLETPYTCKSCEDTGFKAGVACSCRKALLAELNAAELEKVSPAKYCRFDNFDINLYDEAPDDVYGIPQRERMSDILEYCKNYADDFDSESCSLYMHGATGLGKTHLSLAIANVAVRKGYNVIYASAQNLFTALEKDKFGNYGADSLDEYLDCDLLIIDDLGSEFTTQYTVSELYNIINTRINTSKPVIISTNLTETEFEKKYTQRITSRIIGSYESLLFVGRDIRQIKSKSEE